MKPLITCGNGVVLSKFNPLLALLDRFRLLAELTLKNKPRPEPVSRPDPNKYKEKDKETSDLTRLKSELEQAQVKIAALQEEKTKLEAAKESAPQSLMTELNLEKELKGKVPKDVLEGVTALLRQHFESAAAQVTRQYEAAREEASQYKSELQAYKTIAFEVPAPAVDPSKGDFEACLAGELAMMKEGYEKQLYGVKRQQEETVKELARREAQTKREITSIKQEQQLLLKKWELLKS